MIKDKLMIGNWVMFADEYTQVTDVMCDCLNTSFAERMPYDMFEPVKLSPAILEKCGFTNEIEEELPEDAEFLCFFKDNIDVELVPIILGDYKVEGIVLYEDEVEEDGQLVSKGKYEIKSEIQYLHQLQNLYYSLTGTELTITL